MKKKHIIGLSTLLLVLLLGLFTQCYALSESQVENWVYNWYVVRKGRDPDATKTFINNNKTTFQQLATISETYNTFYIGEFQNRDDIIQFQWNTGNGGTMYAANTSNIMASDIYNWNYLQLEWFNNNYNIGTISTTYRFTNIKKDYSYNKRAVVYSGSNQSIICQYDTSRPSTWLDGPYVDALGFTFIPASSSTYADVGDFEDIPFYSISGDDDLYIGQLVIPNEYEISYRTFSNFYWRYNNWQVRELGKVTYLEYFTTENNETFYDVYLYNKYAYTNTIYSLYWTDSTQEPFALAGTNFYIANRYTSIVNGALDPNNTFSGDYDEQYNGEQDNLQDVTNIEEGVGNIILDSSEVDNILSGFDTSGEIANAFGYHDFSTDTDFDFYIPHLFITSVIEDVIDEMMRDGDRYIDVSFHGETPTRIYARYFRTPEDNALIIFVRWCLIFGSIYCFYVYVVKISEELSTLNLRDAVENTDTDRFIYRM